MIINRYGKAESRLGRKMAHFTVTGSSFNDLADKMDMIGIPEHNIKRSGALHYHRYHHYHHYHH